jgi:hypothetical protein
MLGGRLVLVLLVVFGAALKEVASQPASCKLALAGLSFALEQYNDSSSPASILLDEYSNLAAQAKPAALVFPFPPLPSEWVSFQVQSFVSSGAQIGEVIVALNMAAQAMNTSSARVEDNYGQWGTPWYGFGDRAVAAAEATSDKVSKADSYLRATLYYFIGWLLFGQTYSDTFFPNTPRTMAIPTSSSLAHSSSQITGHIQKILSEGLTAKPKAFSNT